MKEIIKTKDEKIKDKLIEIVRIYNMTVESLIGNTSTLKSMIFGDSEITAQEYADALGEDARELFTSFEMIKQFLAVIRPEVVEREAFSLPEIKWSSKGTVEEIIVPIEENLV